MNLTDLFLVLVVPGGGIFLAAWVVAMASYRSRRELNPGGVYNFRRVVLGKNLMAAMIIGSYTCGLVVGAFVLASTTTCTEAEFGF